MKNPTSGRGPRGFTLIELLVVMALMLALVAIGIPSLQNALHQSKMRGMVQEITVALRLARIDAIKTSSQGIVQIVPSSAPDKPALVRAFSDRDSDGRLGANEPVLASFVLPTGVTFEDNAGQLDKDSVKGFSDDPAGGPNMAIFLRGGAIDKVGSVPHLRPLWEPPGGPRGTRGHGADPGAQVRERRVRSQRRQRQRLDMELRRERMHTLKHLPAGRHGAAGFSIIEALIAAAILLIIALGLLPLFSRSINDNVSGNDATQATNGSRTQIEELLNWCRSTTTGC